jgi:hypothetical protein
MLLKKVGSGLITLLWVTVIHFNSQSTLSVEHFGAVALLTNIRLV